MRYLVDSDYVIDALAGVAPSRKLLESLGFEGLAVSIVTLGELFEGAFLFPDSDIRLQTYRHFLVGYTVLNLSEPIIERFAQVRAQLRQQGQLIPDLDLLIAATALVHDLALVTRNRRHFARIAGLQLHPTT